MKNKIIYFLTVYDAEEGGYYAEFSDFYCAMVQGETLEEVISAAQGVLDETVEYMVEKGQVLPEASDDKAIKARIKGRKDVAFIVPLTVYPPAPQVRFNVTTKGDKLARITDYARMHNMTRSEFLIKSALEKIDAKA